MVKYMCRQFVTLLITLFLVTVIIFIIFSLIPGDPVDLLVGVSASEEQRQILREKLGLDQNLLIRYLTWIKGALRGEFGNSIQYSVPVKELIGSRLIVTTWLAILSLFIILLISVPLGILGAYFNKNIIDKLIDNTTIIGLSIPNYFFGILLIWIFGIIFKIFVPGRFTNHTENFREFLRCLFFPALAIAVPKICMVSRFMKSSIMNQFLFPYTVTAKSKGSSRIHIILYHILRNAAIPVATLFGMIAADTLAGSIVIEQVFGIPGIGRLLVGAINSRDFPLVMTLVIYISFVVILLNFIVELMIKVNDPRIRVE